MIIKNANQIKLSQTISGVPDVSGAVERNLQPLVFERMQRTMVDGRMQAVPLTIPSLASIQPLKPQELAIKPTGDRAWSWYMIHSLTNLELKVNDRFVVQGQAYKNMAKAKWNQYGYFYYEVIEDTVNDNGN